MFWGKNHTFKSGFSKPLAAGMIAALGLALAAQAFTQFLVHAPTQISLSLSGGVPDGPSYLPVAGPNGNGLVFESVASNLVPNDTNGVSDVFFRNPITQAVARASVNSTGTEGDAASSSPSISRLLPDGFYAVAFQSRATNLGSTPNPAGLPNIYVHFPTLGITENVSLATNHSIPNGESYTPSITVVPNADGEHKVLIAFSSTATDLVAEEPGQIVEVYLATLTAPTSTNYDPTTLTTITRISRAAVSGEATDGPSQGPVISADGRYVVFSSSTTNLVSPPLVNPNFDSHILRYDIETGETILVSKASNGVPGDDRSLYPQLSYTGRYVTYFTFAKNIVGNTPESEVLFYPYIVRYDGLTDSTAQVNVSADGTTSGLGQLPAVGISSNGRLITFGDSSGSLLPGDTNGQGDVFVKDMETGEVALLSIGAEGQQSNGFSANPTLTAKNLNGLSFAVAFESLATNLTPTSSGMTDVFETGFSIPAPKLTANTILETPPDVTLSGKRLTLATQEFDLADAKVSDRRKRRRSAARSRKLGVRYVFEITQTSTKRGRETTNRRRLISRRNAVSFRQVPGSYQVRSGVRVVNVKTGRTVSRTPYSPVQRFRVR